MPYNKMEWHEHQNNDGYYKTKGDDLYVVTSQMLHRVMTLTKLSYHIRIHFNNGTGLQIVPYGSKIKVQTLRYAGDQAHVAYNDKGTIMCASELILL